MTFAVDFSGVATDRDSYASVDFQTEEGQPYDTAGWTMETRIGTARGTGSPLVTLTSGAGDIAFSTVTNAEDGLDYTRITWRFRPEMISTLVAGLYQHDTVYIVSSRDVAFASGQFNAEKGVIA